jgi:hypothetical protein
VPRSKGSATGGPPVMGQLLLKKATTPQRDARVATPLPMEAGESGSGGSTVSVEGAIIAAAAAVDERAADEAAAKDVAVKKKVVNTATAKKTAA